MINGLKVYCGEALVASPSTVMESLDYVEDHYWDTDEMFYLEYNGERFVFVVDNWVPL